MDWIFDNLQLLLVIAGSIAYWLNQRRREKQGEEADYDGDGIPENRPVTKPGSDALEEDERVRRIQEEIRRKILERRGEAAPAPAPAPSTPFEEPPVIVREQPTFERNPEPEPLPSWREQPVPSRPAPPPIDEGALARQRALQERLQELAERRAAVAAQAARVAPSTAANTPEAVYGAPVVATTRSGPAKALVGDLRDPAALRRAIVLREVLGPPLALR